MTHKVQDMVRADGGGSKETLGDTYPQSPAALETHGSPC